ncbi:glycosyltransferase family 31 protein [Aplosporella prunicola CBS 121167]|uniref:N-acetylgalactosaminide beta-1,3-galactosyltransferase n=1 Tax=Aplosporella prunicola CBS 121167 TaxID=1176127 RepID=A0A6A6BSJ9_9PEZI|nr:glycosyltransferase family 31 protein [Aplosporella prunicola CBS 121167]KAF2146778.1 glycosyltransferase family 31 protein [Aplosporella prunicola CBS 121167]
MLAFPASSRRWTQLLIAAGLSLLFFCFLLSSSRRDWVSGYLWAGEDETGVEYVRPGESLMPDVGPAESAKIGPEESTGVEPEKTTEIEPEKTTGIEPDKTTEVEPEKTTDARPQETAEIKPEAPTKTTYPCQQLPGAEDVLVIMKTGATEAHEKLPTHFNSTFRCTPHYAIFSDLEEEIHGHTIHDALYEIPEEIKQDSPEFRFYDKMRELRADGINLGRLSNEEVRHAAWDLDKWKFLPLMKKALETRSKSKWFVFIEADTYIVWSNLLQWLELFDHTQPYYIGGQTWLGGEVFAHGGTGIIISQKALTMLVEKYNSSTAEFIELTQKHYAGDLILSLAFKTLNISLTATWPIMQGETPFTLDYTAKHMAHPVVSYHHMPSPWIDGMWEYEQKWINGTYGNETILRHKDVFLDFVGPEIIAGDRVFWDNISKDIEEELAPNKGPHSCLVKCEANPECLQWLFAAGMCKLGKVVRLGSAELKEGSMVSGWMVDRISTFVSELGPKADWILESPD